MDNGTETLLNLAYIYMSYGKAKRAADYLLIARETDKNNFHIKKMLATAFKEAGLPAHALLLLKEIITDPEATEADKVTATLLKSLCLQSQNQDTEAKQIFADYLQARKNLARKEFYARQRGASKNAAFFDEEPDNATINGQIRDFSAPPAGARM